MRLAAELSDNAHSGIVDFTRWHGCSLSAFLEALGRQLSQYEPGEKRLPPGLAVVVKDARDITSERLRRPR